MNCENIRWLIQEYIDDKELLSEEEKKQVETHLSTCEECKAYYDEMLLIEEKIKESEIMEPPNLTQWIMEEVKKSDKKSRKTQKWIPVLGSVAAVFLIAVVIQLGKGNLYLEQSKAAEEVMEYDAAYMVEESLEVPKEEAMTTASLSKEETGAGNSFSGEIVVPNASRMLKEQNLVERKIIKRANVDLRTEQYDRLNQNIESWVLERGGFIEESQTGSSGYGEKTLKDGYMVVRVPTEYFEEFLSKLDENSKVMNLSKSGEDVTKQYYETENKAQNYEIQEQRLREIMGKAEKIEDILAIETELNRIRIQIDSLRQTLKTWDHYVTYATIHISMEEVEQIEPQVNPVDKNLWQRAKDGLVDTVNQLVRGLEKLIVKIISNLPYLLILVICSVIVYVMYRKWKKNRRNGK